MGCERWSLRDGCQQPAGCRGAAQAPLLQPLWCVTALFSFQGAARGSGVAHRAPRESGFTLDAVMVVTTAVDAVLQCHRPYGAKSCNWDPPLLPFHYEKIDLEMSLSTQ